MSRRRHCRIRHRIRGLLRPVLQSTLRHASSLLTIIAHSLVTRPPGPEKSEDRNTVDVQYVPPGQSSKP